MAVNIGMKRPTNAIVAKGDPFLNDMVLHLKVETATSCKPGRLVKKGTTDADIVVNTTKNDPYGWLGYEQGYAVVKNNESGVNNSVDGTYAENDLAPVIIGGDIVIVGSLATDNSCVPGDYLYPAASGELQTITNISGYSIPVGRAMESLDYSASSQDVLVKSKL